MILDTNALSAFADGNQNVRDAIMSLEAVSTGDCDWRISIRSAEQPGPRKRIAWLSELMRHWTVLDVSKETAVRYAEMRRQLKDAATPIPSNDAWIAALARQHGVQVLSSDPHFDLVSGIERLGFSSRLERTGK
jgi:tRNA(fMet)-specific endonuclease VapC